MARETDPLNRSTIAVVAQDTGDRYAAPRTNGALELAAAMTDLQPKLNGLLGEIVDSDRRKQTAKGRAAALSTAGERLGDAVRAGKIKKTQNPFFMQAYASEGAAIRAKAAIGELQVQAASWEEQNDPKAFNARWTREVGNLAQTFSQPGEAEGFIPVAEQLTQNTLASNTAQNVQRIEKERLNSLGALGADALQFVSKGKPGVPSPEQIEAALEPVRAQGRSTGLSNGELDGLLVKAVTTAAYATGRPGLIDRLQTLKSSDGKTTLYNLPGVADAAETDKYRIGQSAASEADNRVRAMEGAWKTRGYEAVNLLTETFGNDLISATTKRETIRDFLTEKGYKPQEIAVALKEVRSWVGDYSALGNASFEVYGDSPEGSRMLLRLGMEAATNGYSPGLDAQIQQEVVAGRLPGDEGARMLNTAISRSNTLEAQGRARINFAQAQGDRGSDLRGGVRNATQLRSAALAKAALSAEAQRRTGRKLSQQVRREINVEVVDAALAYMSSNPGDYSGALAAADLRARTIAANAAKRRAKSASNRTASGEIKR